MLTSKSKRQLCRNSTRRSSISIDSVRCNPNLEKNTISQQHLGTAYKQSHINENQSNNWHNVSLSGKILRQIVQYTSQNRQIDENWNFRQNINPNSSRSPFGKKKQKKTHIQIKDIDNFSYSELNNDAQLVVSQQNHNYYNSQQEKRMIIEDFHSHLLRQDIYTENFESNNLSISNLQCKYHPLSQYWQNLYIIQSRQIVCNNQLDYVNINLEKVSANLQRTYEALYHCNKRYLQLRNITEYTSRSQKQRLLFQAQQNHEQLRKLVSPKFNFQQVIEFNIRVLLPSGHNSEKMILAGKFEELFKNKTIKKLGMIVKKHSMSSFDMKLVSDYLKKLSQLEISFNKIIPNEQASEKVGHFQQQAGVLIEKISQLNQLKSYLKSQKNQFQSEKDQNSEFLSKYAAKKHDFLNKLNYQIKQDYKRDGNSNNVSFEPFLQKQYNESISNYIQHKKIQQKLMVLLKRNTEIIQDYKQMLNN